MDSGTNAAAVGGAGIGGFFLGMLIGAVVGGVAALLLTPTTGAQNRQMVMDRMSRMRDIVRSNKQQMQETAEGMQQQSQP